MSEAARKLTPGRIVRRLTGRHFNRLGDAYRRIFVDLDKVVATFAAVIPAGARVIDIGGGDGAVIEKLLTARPDLSVTMCDIAADIGQFLSPATRARVTLRPATDFATIDGAFDVVTITDVVHHVPVDARDGFFRALAESAARWGVRQIIFKDVEPGGLRALLAVWSDWYVTGDRHVVAMSMRDFEARFDAHFPGVRRQAVMPDHPNYCFILDLDDRPTGDRAAKA